MADLYSLLKQFNAIGGMAQTGQSGFCLLMALWQKANELNWINQFTMTNAELLYKAGFNCEKTLIEARNRLSQLGFFKYIKPNNRRKCGTYILNYDLLTPNNYLPGVSSKVNSEPDYLPDVNSNVSSGVSSEVSSDVNSGVSSEVNINKTKLNKTKQNNNIIVLKPDEAEFLAVLETIPNYPFDRQKDLEMYHRLKERYPALDHLEAIKDWREYKADKPLKKGDNPRSQINTAFKKYVEWGRNIKNLQRDNLFGKTVYR
jgi:hypothetical protein